MALSSPEVFFSAAGQACIAVRSAVSECRDLHGDGMAGIRWEWVQLWREYRGMEFVAAGNPPGVFGKRATVWFLSADCKWTAISARSQA